MEKLIEYLLEKPDFTSIFSSILVFSGVVLAIHIMFRLLNFGVHSRGYEDGKYLKKLRYLPCLMLFFGVVEGISSFAYNLNSSLEGTSMQIEKIVHGFESIISIQSSISIIVLMGVLILSFKFEKSPKVRGKRKLEGSWRKTWGSITILFITASGISFSLSILEKVNLGWFTTFLWIIIILILLHKFIKNKPFTQEEFLFKKKSWIKEKLEEQKREEAKTQEQS